MLLIAVILPLSCSHPKTPNSATRSPSVVTRNALQFSQESISATTPELSWNKSAKTTDFRNWQKNARTKFLEVLNYEAHVMTDFRVEVLQTVQFKDFVRQEISYQLEPGFKTTAFVYRPKDVSKTQGAILLWHGHSHGGKKAVAGIPPFVQEKDQHRAAAHQLAQANYFVVAPDMRTFGDSGVYLQHVIASGSALMTGRSIVATYIADSVRTFDLIVRHYGFRANQVGVAGLSLGAQVAMFHAAMDERVAAVVVQGFLSSYRGRFLTSQHDICQYVPGLIRWFDKADIGLMIAPRAALYVSGEKDQMFPVSEAISEFENIFRGYSLSNSQTSALLERHNGAHSWQHKAALQWFNKHLEKP